MMKTLNKIIFLLTMLITFSAGTAFAQDSLYVKPIDIEPGTGTIETLDFILDNSTAYYGFQANIKLPSGLEIETKADGKPEISLSDRAKDGNYQLISNLNNNKREVSIAAFSASDPQLPIEGNSGTLLTIKVKATSSYIGGNVEITNIRFVKDGDIDEPFNSSNSKMGVFPISVSLNEEELVYEEPGEATRLIPTFTPKETTNKNLTWESSDEEVASVDENGEIKILKGGTTIITATTENNKYATCIISVGQPVYEIGLNEYSKELYVDEEFLLIPTFDPDDAVNKMVEWTSDNEEVATVDEKGNVKAHSLGTATITAKALGGKAKDGGKVKATCEVNVVPRPAESVVVIPDSAKLMVGQSKKLEVEILPAETTDKTVTWTSKNPSVATVDEYGNVTAISLGEAEISAMCGNVEGICNITVIPTPVESISLDKNSGTLKVGDTLKLTETILPEDATDKTVTWTSNNVDVAMVDENGLVTAISVGEAIITVTANDGSEVKATCTITVNPTPVTSISLNKESESLKVGETLQLIETVLPEDATDKSVTWTSSDDNIATVDQTGKVTAVYKGSATITATSANGLTASCEVSVKIPATGISLDKLEITIEKGSTEHLIATTTPIDTSDEIIWSSSDEDVATVYDGVVYAKGVGSAIIYAQCSDNIASCSVKVIISPADISLSTESETLYVGQATTLIPNISPDEATDKTVTWSSENEDVAIVDSNGKVTAVAIGTSIITATTVNGLKATCIVKVIPTPANSINLNKATLSLKVGESELLIAKVLPDNTTDKKVTWTSKDQSIAKVDNDGNVTGIALGETIITATCGNASASCTVTIIPTPVESVSLDKTELDLTVEETYILKATILPENASDKSVSWESTDASIATVSANGEVSAIAPGTATIIVTTTNGCKAQCSVTVASKVISAVTITLSQDVATIPVGQSINLIATVLPDNIADKTVTWTSNNNTVASVNSDGTIVANSPGEAIVRASCGNAYAECKVYVVAKSLGEIILSNTSLALIVGDQTDLTATIYPSDTSVKTLTWKSSDENIVTVSGAGMTVDVFALKAGTATITVLSENGLSATCVVNVSIIPVSDIIIDKTELTLENGKTDILTATIIPDNATDKSITWKSSDLNVATVSDNGLVTATGVGVATIYASASNGKTVYCNVTVTEKVISDLSISLDRTQLDLFIGSTQKLTPTVTPDDIADKTLLWKSSDEKIANVDSDGNVTGIALGEAVITVACGDAIATCNVKVVPIEVESITLSNSNLLMRVGKIADLTAIILPANASDQAITWSISDASIATLEVVDGKAIVTALKEGTAKIIAKASNGVEAICDLTVSIIAVEKIKINDIIDGKLELDLGKSKILTATVSPDDATDKTVTWKSSNPEVVSISADGQITAVAGGSATIYASSSNGLTDECVVTVPLPIVPVTEITLSQPELLMREGFDAELIAIVKPENATDKSVFWKSDNEDVAKVDQNGKVYALTSGTAVITVSSVPYPEIKNQCKVIVMKESDIIPVKEISINERPSDGSSLILEYDNPTQLTVTILPVNATDKSVTWKSSNPEVATVSSDGKVTAINGGDAIIYASSSNGLTAECNVTVPVPVTEITLSQPELLMREGFAAELIAIVKPENATFKSLIWNSDNKEVATVDENGLVTFSQREMVNALQSGTATITVTSAKYPSIKAECKVTVVLPIIAVEDIVLNIIDENIEMTVGDTHTIVATITPDDATDKTVTWESSDKTIAEVNSEGVVTAVSPGEAIIYVSSSNGITKECHVKVLAKIIAPTSITLDKNEAELFIGDNLLLNATIAPEDASDKTVVWESSDEKVATVDAFGNVNALAIGETIITASCGNVSATCVITVLPIMPTSVTLSNPELIIPEGDVTDLIAIVFPENATDKSVTWKSDNESVATVDEYGNVKAIKAGNATITVTTINGKIAYCAVTVFTEIIQQVTDIILDKSELTLIEEESYKLNATILPSDASDKTITWISLNPAIASVSDDGTVTAHVPGKTTIMASSSNGISKSCEVTVRLTTFDDGILRYKVISDNTVEVIGLVNPDTESVKIRQEATYSSPYLTKSFSVTTIGKDAFSDSNDLKKVIIFTENIPAIEGNPFPLSTTIYVADTEEYKKDPDWGKIPNTIKGFVTIDAPSENPIFSLNESIQISSDIVIDDKPTLWTSSNEAIATVDNYGKASLHYVGQTTITATCDGYSDSFVLTVNPLRGDANWDGVVNVADPVNVANYVVKKNNNLINWEPSQWGSPASWTRGYWNGFYNISSDINGQEGITVSDASEVVSIILSQASPAYTPRMIKGAESFEEGADALTTCNITPIDMNIFSIPVKLDNSEEYVALQADIRVPAGMILQDVKAGKRTANHRLSSRRIDDSSMRVVLFDLNNSAFADNGEAIFEVLVNGDPASEANIDITNIVASDINSNCHILIMKSDEGITGLETVSINEVSIKTWENELYVGNAKGMNITVCTIDGGIVKSYVAGSDSETIGLTKGIYIVTVDKKTVKVAVK